MANLFQPGPIKAKKPRHKFNDFYYQKLKDKLLGGHFPQKDRFALGGIKDVLNTGVQFGGAGLSWGPTPTWFGKYKLPLLQQYGRSNFDLLDDLQRVGAINRQTTANQFVDSLAQYGTKGIFGNTYISPHDLLQGIVNPQIKHLQQEQTQLGGDLSELGQIRLDTESKIESQRIANIDKIQQQTFKDFEKKHYTQTGEEFFKGVQEEQQIQRQQLYEQTANEALIAKIAEIKKINAAGQQQEIQDQTILKGRGLGGSSIAQNITTQKAGQNLAQKSDALTNYAQQVSQAAQLQSENAVRATTKINEAKLSQTILRTKSHNFHKSTSQQHVLNEASIAIQQIGIEYQVKRITIQTEVDKIKGIIANLQHDLMI